MGVAQDLATELDTPPVGELDLFYPSTDPSSGLQDRDLGSACFQVARRSGPARPAPTTTTSVRLT